MISCVSQIAITEFYPLWDHPSCMAASILQRTWWCFRDIKLTSIHVLTFKSVPLLVHCYVQNEPLCTATTQQKRENELQAYISLKITLNFPIWENLNSTPYSKTSVCPLTGKTCHWEKGIGRFIWLIPNSCLIAAVLCAIRPRWAAQSRASEEWKNKAHILVKDPFHCANDISGWRRLHGGKKDTLKRLVEEEDTQLLFSVLLYDATLKASILYS